MFVFASLTRNDKPQHYFEGERTNENEYRLGTDNCKKGKRKVQGVPQSQAAALPRPQEEEETDT